MKQKNLKVIFLVLSGMVPFSSAAQDLIHNLEKVLYTQENDTNKINTLNDLAWEYSSIDLNKADSFSRAALLLSEKLKFIKGRSSAYNTLGLICLEQNKTDDAVKNFRLSVADKETLGQLKGKATVLSNLGIAYKNMGKFKEAISVYEQSLKARIQLNDAKGQGDSYNNIGNAYADLGEMTKALDYFNKAYALRLQVNDFLGLAQTYNNMAGIFGNRGDYQKDLEYMYRGAKLLDSLKVFDQLAVVYANISRVSKNLKNYDNAMTYALKSAELNKKVNSESGLLGAYICMADVYYDRADNSRACEHYKLALDLIEKGNNTFYRSHCYNGIALCLENLGKIQEAQTAFEKGLEVARSYGNKREILNSLTNTARFYSLHMPEKDIYPMLNEALNIAKKESYGDLLMKVYRQLAFYFAMVKKKPEMAVPYYENYVTMNDSVFSEDVKSAFAELNTKFETQKKDAEINLLKQGDTIKTLQLQEEELSLQKRNYALASLALLILLVLSLGYLYLKNQKIKHNKIKEEAIREAEVQERLRLAKDIHDDFGSGLTKIRFLGELIASQAGNNKDIQSGVRSMSEVSAGLVDNMRDLVWTLDPENTSLDSLVARVREYSSDYLDDLGIPLTVYADDKIPSVKITKEAHRHILFIIKEALQNIVKHSGCRHVKLQIRLLDRSLEFTLSDDGKGLSAESRSGNGLKNMKHRAGLIGASMEMRSGAGAGTELLLKVNINQLIRN